MGTSWKKVMISVIVLAVFTVTTTLAMSLYFYRQSLPNVKIPDVAKKYDEVLDYQLNAMENSDGQVDYTKEEVAKRYVDSQMLQDDKTDRKYIPGSLDPFKIGNYVIATPTDETTQAVTNTGVSNSSSQKTSSSSSSNNSSNNNSSNGKSTNKVASANTTTSVIVDNGEDNDIFEDDESVTSSQIKGNTQTSSDAKVTSIPQSATSKTK